MAAIKRGGRGEGQQGRVMQAGTGSKAGVERGKACRQEHIERGKASVRKPPPPEWHSGCA